MTKLSTTIAASIAAAALTLTGCANMSETQQGTAKGAGAGAVVGALLGSVTGGSAGQGAVELGGGRRAGPHADAELLALGVVGVDDGGECHGRSERFSRRSVVNRGYRAVNVR